MGVDNELHALGAHLFQTAVDEVLLHLEIRDAIAQQTADAVGLLEYGDGVAGARQLLGSGQTRGSGATIATRLPVLTGGSGTIQPSSQARSTMVFSICLMVTGGSLMPSTQAASHGAGQMRPVNSGKLLVECSTRIASRQRPR